MERWEVQLVASFALGEGLWLSSPFSSGSAMRCFRDRTLVLSWLFHGVDVIVRCWPLSSWNNDSPSARQAESAVVSGSRMRKEVDVVFLICFVLRGSFVGHFGARRDRIEIQQWDNGGGWRAVVLVLGIYFKEKKHKLTKWRFVFFICTYSNHVQNGLFRWTVGSGRNRLEK